MRCAGQSATAAINRSWCGRSRARGFASLATCSKTGRSPRRTIACRGSHTNKRLHFAARPTTSTLHTPPSGTAPALIKAPNWLTHLEYDWESPVWAPLLQRLAERNRLIRYDTRGTGLSDREVTEFSFDGFARDFESVVKAVKADRFAILGISQGAAVAVHSAAPHPERVANLILS